MIQSNYSRYVRRTLPLSGTVARHTARLDLVSALAVSYAQTWLKDGPGSLGVTVHQSGVIRRALAVYMRHLEAVAAHPELETAAIRRSCKAMGATAGDQEAAFSRLAALNGRSELPSFRELFGRGPVDGGAGNP